MKKLLEKLKDWSTRKTTLWYVIVSATIYMLVSTLYTIRTFNYLDSTTTTAYFGFSTAIGGLGGGITIAEVIKHNDEPKG